MKKLLLVALLSAMALGAGCAAQKVMTPEEIAAERERQLKMITRVYPDKKAEDVILAADRVFRLADDDYTVSHSPTGLHAQRNWMVYMVITAAMGTDNWNLVTENLPEGGVKVMVTHSGQGSSVTAMPVATTTGGYSATAVTTPGMQNMTTQPAIYQLFFARLDYFLGKRADWVTCKQAGDLFTEGFLDPFCTVANDRTPDGLSAAQRRTKLEESKQTQGVSIN